MSEKKTRPHLELARSLARNHYCNPPEECGLVEDIENALDEVARAARAEELERCARQAASFSTRPNRRVHPDIPWESMNEPATIAAHSVAQQIAAEIRALAEEGE